MVDPSATPRALTIVRVYARALRGVPAHIISLFGIVLTVVGIVSTLLLLFNQPLARRITAFDGISPWFAVAPVLIFTGLAVLREIHIQYQADLQHLVNARRLDAVAFEEERAQAATELASARADVTDARDEVARVRDAEPKLVLGEPREVNNQTLERTELTNERPGRLTSPQVRVVTERLNLTVWRIPITNEGGAATNTHVKLTSIDPSIPQGRWPGTLHLAGDNPDDHAPTAYTRSRAFPLPKNAMEEIDLVAMQKQPPHRCFIFAVESSDAAVEVTLGSGQTFRVTAFSSNGEPTERDYWVRIIDGDPARLTVERRQ